MTNAQAGFSEPAIAMLDDGELLAHFSTVARVVSKRFLHTQPCLSSWSVVLDYLKANMAFRETEQFRVLFLDKKNRLIVDETMGEGTVDHCPVYPREIAKRALAYNACAVILAHNHPSGDPTPSSADIAMTKKVAEALEVFSIAVHDHIVVGRNDHASMRALRLI